MAVIGTGAARARAAIALAAAGLASACGAAPVRPDANAAFAQIQVHEATIAHREAEADACEGEAPCPAAEAVCEAADSICELARQLDDRDADARCALARRRCRGLGDHAARVEKALLQPRQSPIVRGIGDFHARQSRSARSIPDLTSPVGRRSSAGSATSMLVSRDRRARSATSMPVDPNFRAEFPISDGCRSMFPRSKRDFHACQVPNPHVFGRFDPLTRRFSPSTEAG